MLKRILLWIIFLYSFYQSAKSQNQLGISNSNFAGLNGIWLNPASIADHRLKWDANILGINANVDNNFVFLRDANIIDLIRDGSYDIGPNNAYKIEHLDTYTFGIYEQNKPFQKHIHTSTKINLPSLMISKDEWSYAFLFRNRFAMSLISLNKNFTELFYEGLTRESLQGWEIDLNRFRINAMVWNEYGFTAAKLLEENRNRRIKVGGTMKLLHGYANVHLLSREMTAYVPDDTSLFFIQVSAKGGLGHINYQQYENAASFNDLSFSPAGKGVGFDAGIIIEEKRRIKKTRKIQCPTFDCVEKDRSYHWRLGVSLLDIGFIRFKTNSRLYDLDGKTAELYNVDEFDYTDPEELDSVFFQEFYNDINAPADQSSFSAYLPAALSLQFDYHIWKNFYFNTTWIQRLPHFYKAGIDRGNNLSFTPRFDHRRFGLAIPLHIYQYVNPRFGAAISLNQNIIIGTDHLGAVFGKNITGADIYFALKINGLKRCKKSKKDKNRKHFIKWDPYVD